MFCASYVYLFNLRWTGFTSPQPIVGQVYPSTLAFYPSKGRVDGSLDEAVALHVKRYDIDSLTGVYYSFLSCYGSGHMLDPIIVKVLITELIY